MAQIDSCIKRIFIVFNFIFAIVGGVIISMAVLAQTFTSQEEGGNELQDQATGICMLYIIGTVTVVIAIMGACGAHKENKSCLVTFLVFMIVGCLLMFLTGISEAVNRPNMEAMLEMEFRSVVPLDRTTRKMKELMDTLQSHMHCCGLFSYEDWEDSIPDSCDCSEMVEEYECRQVNYYRDYFQMKTKTIYRKPCFPIIKHYFLMALDISLGVVFFLATLALLGMILSFIMIRQLRPPNRSSLLLTAAAVSTPEPPKYQELNKLPPPY